MRSTGLVSWLVSWSIVLGSLVGVVTGCSVDENANSARDDGCKGCRERGGTCIDGNYCVLLKVGESGTGGTAAADGGGAPEPCTKAGDTRFCYTGKSGTERTAPCRAGLQTCVDGVWG